MLSKIRLDQTKKFEVALATKKISEMLIAYINGHEHYLAIGAEKGDIQKWDDFVIERADGSYEQIQVKRQLTDFSNEPCTRNTITQGVNAGKLKHLSPLDESIACLADWCDANDSQTAKPHRRFVIEVPDLTVDVKEDFQLREFHQFIHTHIRPTTTIDTLQPLTVTPIGQKIYEWLKTWCRFKDWEHMLKALKILEIRHSGTEVDLNNQTETILTACFQGCRDVRLKIQSYID
ncbi:MAG: hypothetical protein K0Q79_698 [Flavipsychrobacter sp.]|nr:hypothetical protein [Flavipsychrobacter sp.]